MSDGIQKLFEATDELRDKANVNAAFGEPIVSEGRTIIPVAKVGYGFGVGFGSAPEEESEEENEGGGGAGMASAQPMAVIEVTEEGVYVEPVVDEQKIAIAGTFLAGWLIFWIAITLTKIFGKK